MTGIACPFRSSAASFWNDGNPPISAVRRSCRVDCGQLDPGAVIRADPGESQPRMPERLDQEELADCSAGRDAVYQLAALTVGAHLVVADG